MTTWLDESEVARLTGYKRASFQRKELLRRGYRFDLDRFGKPLVKRSEIEGRQSPVAAGPNYAFFGGT